MDIDFTRLDLMQCGALNRKTLKVLPMGKKKQQKVVVGDESGVLTCFGVTKGSVVNRFKTLPSKEVGRVELGGPTKSRKDKISLIDLNLLSYYVLAFIFAAAGQTIIGVTKKGKEFFRFETTLTETIHSMHVEGLSIWTGGEYMYNQFIDGKDKQFYMASDRINDMCCTNITSDADYDAVLACQDRFVRVIQGSDLLYDVRVDGAATAVDRLTHQEKTGKFSTNKEILYGTSTGTLGQLLANNTTIEKGWTMEPEKRAGGIRCIALYDVTKKGVKDIVVGRDDGTIEVLVFDHGPVPKVMWKTNINESIQSLDIGQITAAGSDELVVGSYSGKVISFAPVIISNKPTIGGPDEALQKTPAAVQEETSKKIRAAQQEIDKLAERLKKEKEKHQKVSNTVPVVLQQALKVQSKFELTADGIYVLTLEVKMPLDTLILHADVPLEIEEYDKTQCILSRTKPNTEEGTYLLATCKILENTNRIEVKIRSVEGQHGTLSVYVIPVTTTTPKQSQLICLPIKPLSLHQRVDESENLEHRLTNEVKLTGSFSVSEVHSWISLCLPEVPEKITSEECTLNFKSVYVGTLLKCFYKRGEASFKSDSVYTLSTLKDFISREATARKSKFNISVTLKDTSVNDVLDLIHPKLEYQFSLTSKAKLISALMELKLNEPDTNFLSPPYADILQHADKIKKEYDIQPRALEQLFGVIVDLYISKYKFKGKKVSANKEAELKRQLANYNLVQLKSFFND